MTSIKRREVLSWLATIFQESPDALLDDRSRESIGTWDSMATLMLIAEFDERLHVTIEEQELKNLASIGDIFSLLRLKHLVIEEE